MQSFVYSVLKCSVLLMLFFVILHFLCRVAVAINYLFLIKARKMCFIVAELF